MPEAPEPRVAIVTGARKGLGRHLAERLLADGWAVEGCSRDESDLAHPAYRHHRADVADERALMALFGDVRRTHGRLDALINNAGIGAMNHALTTPARQVERLLAVNVVGTFLAAREAAKLMRKRGAGRIVNFASVATPFRLEGEAAYAASKAAVVSLTETLAREFAPYGVTVNAVGPTPVRTDLIGGVSPAKLDALVARQAIKRFGTPDDVANVVEFFLRPESAFVTGQTLYLGGL